MIEKNIYTKFTPGITDVSGIEDNSMIFAFYSGKLLVKIEEDKADILRFCDIKAFEAELGEKHFLGNYDGNKCFAVEFKDNILPPEGMDFKELRPLIELLDEELFLLAGRAIQIVDWDKNHQYCGRCGSPTILMENERAKQCPSCGFISYPRISPAIIVAITRGDEILLAHNSRFRNNMYSVLAGFVEPGETFEECVGREVGEEVGIRVKNVKYFASQPWPFPNSLMVAFTAEYHSGEIKPDGVEISDAGWFNVSNLPGIPTRGSVARKLIDWYLEKNIKK